MKKLFLRILAGVVCFGIVFFVDNGFTEDPDTLMFFALIFFLPAILLTSKRFIVWITSFLLLTISIWYFTVVPPAVQPSTCGSILCGMDGRPFYALFAYIGIIIILGFLQLIHFLQNGKSEKELKSQIK